MSEKTKPFKHSASKKIIERSISAEFLSVGFSLYVLVALSTTGIHMLAEYNSTKDAVISELEEVHKSFKFGLSNALWELNDNQLKSMYEGMYGIAAIVGIKIENGDANIIGVAGNYIDESGKQQIAKQVLEEFLTPNFNQAVELEAIKKEDLIIHKAPLTYVYRDNNIVIGSLTLYSSNHVVFNQVKLSFLIILVNAVIKTVGLWVIFLWVGRRLISQPLKRFILETENVTLDNMSDYKVDISSLKRNEIWVLEQSFNSMIEKLGTALGEREELHASLEKNQLLFKQLADMAPVGIFHANQEGHYTYVNDGWCKLSGLSSDEALGLKWLDNLVEDDWVRTQSNWRLTVDNRQNFSQEYRFKQGEDQEFWVFCQAVPQVDIRTNEVEYFGTITDIDDLKKSQIRISLFNKELEQTIRLRTLELSNSNEHLMNALEKLKSIQADLVRSEKMAALTTLVTGVAHELNTPLGVAITSTTFAASEIEMVKKYRNENTLTPKKLDDFLLAETEALNLISDNLLRASKLVGLFKTVAVDHSEERKERIKLNSFFNEVCTLVTSNYPNLAFSCSVECEQALTFLSFPNALQHILRNLLENALTYGVDEEQQISINIRAKTVIKSLVIVFEDNGRGMDTETLKRLFDPFYTTNRGGNVGLGAHIVYNLVTQKFGGKITCTSQINKGTVFEIILPLGSL